MARRRRNGFPVDLTLDKHTAHGIYTVALFAVAAFLLVAMFDLAGKIGMAADQAMAHALGWDRIVLPFFLIAIGIHEVAAERLPLKASNVIGFILFFLSLNPFLQTLSSSFVATEAELTHLGGKLGAIIAAPVMDLLGRFGAGVLFAALALVSVLLIFNTSLRRVVELCSIVLRFAQRVLLIVFTPFKWLIARRAERLDERVRGQALERPAMPQAVEEVPEDGADETETEGEEVEETDTEDDRPRVVAPPKPKKKHPMIQVPIELLSKRDQKPTSGDIQHNQHVIQRTLEMFGIPVEMADVAVGPTVTQFTLKPAEGVKLAKITALHNDLALALAAHPIRIEAPIPGKSLVGVEVPNQSVATVGLREMFETREWKENRDHLAFSLGRDVTGKPWFADVSRMPHMLVAGATGSGKSVCLNTLIVSLLYANGPDDLKLILVDPKRVELQVYNGVPHLVTPVITDVDKTVNALKWGLREMDRRFDVLSKFGARDIASYNARSQEKLPYVVFIIDELADLMVTAMHEVEGPIVRLSQMARAVGIHLVLATQRPSVDVLTGLIKANVPARFAFAVASSTDSRTILDATGAEKLLGRGDMLFQTSDMSTPKRLQGSFVSDDEIGRVVEFLKASYEPAEYDPGVVEKPTSATAWSNGIADEDSDPLIPDAKEEIIRAGKASASLLQRRLKVGYARAARLLDLLEQEGFIGPGDGAKPREILNVQFTKNMEQVPSPASPSDNAVLEQVNREIPDIEEEEG